MEDTMDDSVDCFCANPACCAPLLQSEGDYCHSDCEDQASAIAMGEEYEYLPEDFDHDENEPMEYASNFDPDRERFGADM